MAKIFLTIPAGVENGQVIKSQDMVLQDPEAVQRGFIHNFHHRQSLLLNEIREPLC
jgi:hypothetical protein